MITAARRAVVLDTREVHVDLRDPAPESRTPAGRTPIACRWARIGYHLADGRLCSVEVAGTPADGADTTRRRRYRVDRHGMADLPGWLAELVETYRPGRAR